VADQSPTLSRRGLLGAAAAGLVAAGAGAATAGCSPAPSTTAVSAPLTNGFATRRLRAGSRPFPTEPAGTDMLPKIRHVVVLMMENHSFDNYFGLLGRGDGFHLDASGAPTNANPASDGTSVTATHAPTVCQAHVRISQSWVASHTAWDHGANDGFARATGPDAMHYFTSEDLPFYHSLGRTFTLCDRWFASTMAQTYPNRRFLLAGSAFGLVDDSFPAGFDRNPRPGGFGTVFELLTHFGIDWKNYYSDLPSGFLFPYVTSLTRGGFAKVDHFLADAAAGTLPFFSLVDPNFGQSSEENPQDVRNGEAFSAQVIDAVLHSPAWSSTVLIWLHDEHGGYYDHVPPQPAVPPDAVAPNVAPDATYGDHYSFTGFRVPAVVVSPWSRRGYVSHVIHDHTSILKLVETKWNLPALSDRDANADNLLDTLDLGARRPPFAVPPTLAAPAGVGPSDVADCAAAAP
jgi:phospholipase C